MLEKWSKASASSGKAENNNLKAVFYTAAQTKAWKAKKAAAATDTKKTAKVPAHVGTAAKAGGQRRKPHKTRVSQNLVSVLPVTSLVVRPRTVLIWMISTAMRGPISWLATTNPTLQRFESQLRVRRAKRAESLSPTTVG